MLHIPARRSMTIARNALLLVGSLFSAAVALSCGGLDEPGDSVPEPPSAPASFSATSSEDGFSVSIAWAPLQEATEYLVYRADGASAEFSFLGTVKGSTNYTDETTLPGVSYRYRASGRNSAGEGAMCAALDVVAKSVTLSGTYTAEKYYKSSDSSSYSTYSYSFAEGTFSRVFGATADRSGSFEYDPSSLSLSYKFTSGTTIYEFTHSPVLATSGGLCSSLYEYAALDGAAFPAGQYTRHIVKRNVQGNGTGLETNTVDYIRVTIAADGTYKMERNSNYPGSGYSSGYGGFSDEDTFSSGKWSVSDASTGELKLTNYDDAYYRLARIEHVKLGDTLYYFFSNAFYTKQ